MQQKYHSISSVLKTWHQSHKIDKNDQNQEKYLDIALRLYVLPGIDPTLQGIAKGGAEEHYKVLKIDQLQNALTIFDRKFADAVAEGKTSKSTGKNYRSALKKFMAWVEMQPWWKGMVASSIVQKMPRRSKLPSMPKKKRGKLIRRSLKKDELSASLQKELADFQEFRQTGGLNLPRAINHSLLGQQQGFIRRPKLDPVDPSTIQQEEEKILYFWGWYSQQYPGCELSLALLTDIDLLDDFICWVLDERGTSSSTGIKLSQVAISIAKWLNYNKTNRRNWSDIPLILELRNLKNEYLEDYNEEKVLTDSQKWEKKELNHDQLREVVDYLRTLCSNYGQIQITRGTNQYSARTIRNLSAITRSWQTYLLVKLLVYCPVRQEEIRNFVLGTSLLRTVDDQGQVRYIVKLTEHKRDQTGHIRHYPLPAIVNDDLDIWLFTWRPLILEHLKTLEGWMEFWNYPPDAIEKHQRKIDGVKDGTFIPKSKLSPADYIRQHEERIAGIQYRIDAWPIAQNNMATHDLVFFSFGKKDAVAFGNPLNISIFWQTVRRATAIATNELYGAENVKWINPHAFRHIAEKHLRLLGKTHLADAFGALIGHSEDMGSKYANQILSEYEITEDIVDNWWIDI
ncbi:MAG: hypothetical protein VKL20_07955 [Synechocystis sp.]|nr:hypothetical protein [Synechocystis sp.]